jgi:hypothetical protein
VTLSQKNQNAEPGVWLKGHLPNMTEALGSIPNTKKKRKKKVKEDRPVYTVQI